MTKCKSKEEQEQWEIRVNKTDKNAAKGGIRIRKTVVDGGAPEYVLTTKVVVGPEEKDEVPIPTTEDNFNQFRLLSEGGMLKHRYFFPVEGTDMVWEFDLFPIPGKEGEYFPWCKIDLEVTDMSAPVPHLPFQMHQLITAPYGKRTPEEEAIVSGLYKSAFILPNQHLGT